MGRYGQNVLNVSETTLEELLLENMHFGDLEELCRIK